MKMVGLTRQMLVNLHIAPEVWEGSAKYYQSNQQTAMMLQGEMQKLIQQFEKEVVVDESKPLLTKEETMKYVQEMEERKIQVVKKI